MTKGEFDNSVRSFRVGDWLVRPGACEIAREDRVVKLEPKVMDLLLLLASRPGEVLTRIEIEEQVWSDVVVSYDALTKSIGKLRDALGDTGKPSTYVQTIPKKGYRLIAPVANDEGASRESQSGDDNSAEVAKPARRNRFVVSYIVTLGAVISLVLGLLNLQKDDSPNLHNPGDTSSKPSLIVLPFRNLNDDPQQDYFTQGITDDLITV